MRARTAAIAIMLAACAASACSRPPAAPVEADAVQLRGSVSISGDDALAQVLSWSLPKVALAEAEADAARHRADEALAQGDLFETADAAIPLYLALQGLSPDDAGIAAKLAQSRQALIAQGDAALARDSDLEALRAAQRRGAVLGVLWPREADSRAYQRRVDAAEQAWERNAEGERALLAGQLGEQGGGALAAFRAVLAMAPGQARASRGLAAVEQALLWRAETAARRGDFDAARQQLAYANGVRHHPQTVAAVRARIEALRAGRIRVLRDEGLIALGDADGLRTAQERLADLLHIASPGDPAAAELRHRIDMASHYGLFRPGQVFTDGLTDGSRGPVLVVVPHGGFQMGASADDPEATAAERPRHYVRLERGFAMSRTEVTVGEFARFVEATGYTPRATKRGHSMAYDARSGNFAHSSGVDWRSGHDGRPAAHGMPVLHVTARDAEAYAEWLSGQAGAHYRLPSEAEFEYALRAGGQGRYPWGDGPPPQGSGNLTGAADVSPQGRRWSNAFRDYGDGYWGPAPVGSFAANAYGLHDLAGNVSEWVADCWHEGYRRAPATGAAWINPGCRTRLYRGGSWASAPKQVRSSWREAGGVDVTNARVGFRLVRQL